MKKFGRLLGFGKGSSGRHHDSSARHQPDYQENLTDDYLEHDSRERLRQARDDIISGIEKKLAEITQQYGDVSDERKQLQAEFNKVEKEISVLDGQKKACERQIEDLKIVQKNQDALKGIQTTDPLPLDSEENCQALVPAGTAKNSFLKFERQRLLEMQSDKIALEVDVKRAKENLQDMTDLYDIVFSTQSVPTRVTVAVRGRKSNAELCVTRTESDLKDLINREKEITRKFGDDPCTVVTQKIGDDQCTEVATIDTNSAHLKTSGEDPNAKQKLLEELKMQAQQDLTNLEETKSKLSEELEEAIQRESEVITEKEGFEKELADLKQMDREQHARTQILIQGSLIDKEVNELKSTLLLLKIITRNMTQHSKGFVDIWDYLESEKLISVGDYYVLRKSLYMRGKRELVSNIEKMEDKLLGKYGDESPSSQPSDEPDAPAKLLQTYSQTVDRKVRDKVYNQPGGPCRYLQDVMVVMKVYLQNLSPDEKTESSEALYTYVDQKLKSQDIDIMNIEDKYTSELRNSKGVMSTQNEKIRQLESDKDRLKEAEVTLKSIHDQNKNTLEQELATAKGETVAEKLKVQGLERDKQEALETNAKTTEEAKVECNKLRAEKENTYQLYKGLLENIDGTRRAIRGEYNQLELKKDEYRAEEVEELRIILRNMRENYDQELKKRRKNHTDELTEVQTMLENFKSSLEEVIHRQLQDDSRDVLEQELFNLQKEYTTSLADWDDERTTLKCDLVEANIDRKIATYELNNLQKKLQYFEQN